MSGPGPTPGTRAPATDRAAVATILAVVFAGSVMAAEEIDPQLLIERAIESHGGRSALRSLPDFKALGTAERNGRAGLGTMDIVVYERADGGRRIESTIAVRGRKVTSIEIFDGSVCKRNMGSGWDDLPLDENRDRVTHRVSILVDASERQPVLLGEGTEADVDVWKVEIADGTGRAVLSLAKSDHRLVAIEYPGTEAEGMGTKKSVTAKLIHRGFQVVGGVKLPIDTELQKDGVFERRTRFETLEPIERWDEYWLQAPSSRRRFIPPEGLAN